MDNDLKRAVEEFKPFARSYRAVLALYAELEKLGDLDAQRQELEGALRTLNGAIDSAKKTLATTTGEAKQMAEDAASKVHAARTEAEAQRKRASEHYNGECGRAKADAAKITREASDHAERIVAAANTEAEKVRTTLAQEKRMAGEATATARTALESAQKVLAERRAELADLDARLARSREEARKIMGVA